MIEGINNGHSSIIHAMFNAIEHTYDEQNLRFNFKYYYTKEFTHALNQTVDILHWFKYSSFNDILWRSDGKFTQSSMMLEYIIVRCIYLLHFDRLEIMTRTIKPSTDNAYILEFMKYFIRSNNVITECMKNE